MKGWATRPGSVDQTGNYVFEVQPQVLTATHKKLGNYWDLDAGSNTMYTLWNPTEKAQDVVISLFYDSGQSKYKIPVHVGAQSSVMLDLKNIIEANAPDADGNVFPASTSQGSATIESADGPAGQMSLIISGAVFNVVTATCFGCCVPCCGTSDVYLDPGSDVCAVGDTEQFQGVQEACDGSTSTFTVGDWSSSNTAVMTVNSSGLMSAVGPGTATLTFTSHWPATSDCGQPVPGECPITNFQASGPVKADDFTLSNAQTVTDGDSGHFTVTISPNSSTPSSYQWSFTVPSQGAGNAPKVNFSTPTAAQTDTDGHWYALPNVSCPVADQPGAPARISPYTISASVKFQDGGIVKHTTTLNANFIWFTTGRTGQADITGTPAMAPDGLGVWRITGIGTMTRALPVPVILVPTTSQFYNKSNQHEQVHVRQWQTGGQLSDLYIPSVLLTRVSGFTGTSQADLTTQYNNALQSYRDEEVNIFIQRTNSLEHEAFAVSDAIAPQYMIQNCGRF